MLLVLIMLQLAMTFWNPHLQPPAGFSFRVMGLVLSG
jgi:hypothetical protein